jgi:hypothetical protein
VAGAGVLTSPRPKFCEVIQTWPEVFFLVRFQSNDRLGEAVGFQVREYHLKIDISVSNGQMFVIAAMVIMEMQLSDI